MTTITLKINEKSKVGKALLSFIEVFSNESKSVEVIKKPNKETREAIQEVEQRMGTKRGMTSKELFKELGI